MSERNGIFEGDNPFEIARRWLDEAHAVEVNDPTAMALATVDDSGMPNVRMVLLKEIEADAFVFPSLEEGGPQVTYEAAGHALPLVVTPMGGGRIADDSNAIIIEPGDADALATALTRLAQDGDLRSRLGAAARMAAPQYDWRAVARQRLTGLMDAVRERHTSTTDARQPV